MTEVSLLLHRWNTKEFVRPTEDCVVPLADYVRDRTGKDPIREYRNRYTTPKEAFVIMNECGGFCNLIKRTFGGCLVRKIGAPEMGDIVLAEVCEQWVVGVHTGKFLAFRTEEGTLRMTKAYMAERVWLCV